MKRYLKMAGLAALMALPSQAKAQVTYPYSGTLPQAIPDNTPAGFDFDITVPDNGQLTAASLTFNMGTGHTWVGDLIITMTHVPSGATSDILRRAGATTAGAVGSALDFTGTYTFADTGASRVADAVALGTNPIAPGTYRATNNLFNGNGTPTFTGEVAQTLSTNFASVTDIAGTWRINISDNASGDLGTINSLSITLTATAVPEPTSMLLCGIGATGFVVRRLRRKS